MVAIKDFGMPSCCFNCDMQIDGYSAGYYCAITEQELNDNYTLEHRHPNCPLVETEEPTLAKWIYQDKLPDSWEVPEGYIMLAYRCSKCNGLAGFQFGGSRNKYCPYCGAKMDEE